MANKIQFKRGSRANLPTLSAGEPAFTTDTKEVFIGSDSGNIGLAKSATIGDTASLATNNKSNVVGAINEIFQSANNAMPIMMYTAGGTANALTLTIPGITTYQGGITINFIASANSNPNSVVNVNVNNFGNAVVYKNQNYDNPSFIAGMAYTIWFKNGSDCFFVKDSNVELNERIDNVEAIMEQKVTSGSAIISPEPGEWEDDITDYYVYRKRLPIPGVKESSWVDISIDRNYQRDTQDIELCPTVDEFNGGIILYSNSIPIDAIPIRWKAISPVYYVGRNWGNIITTVINNIYQITSIIYINGTVIAASNSGDMILSNNYGQNWGPLISNPFHTGGYKIASLAYVGDECVIAGGDNGIIAYSYDHGSSWTVSTINNPFGASSIYTIANVNDVAIAGGYGGKIAYSLDNGTTWSNLITNPFGTSSIFTIANVNGVAIAGTSDGKIARSTDNNGATWGSLISNPFGGTAINAIANVDGVAIAVGYGGKIARSTDSGATWSGLITNPFGTSNILTIASVRGVAIAGSSDGKIARSTDDGLTWGSLITNPFGGSGIYAITNVDGVAIAGGYGGKIARSVN